MLQDQASHEIRVQVGGARQKGSLAVHKNKKHMREQIGYKSCLKSCKTRKRWKNGKCDRTAENKVR